MLFLTNQMKMKTIIIWVLAILATLVLLMWTGSKNISSPSSNNPISINKMKSQLITPEKLYDFGTISMKNGIVNHIFKITNSSKKDIYMNKIYTSCVCTTVYIENVNGEKGPFGMEGMGYLLSANEVIKAGKSRNIKVVYDPNAHGPAGVGLIDRFIMITDDSSNTLQLEIKALVTP